MLDADWMTARAAQTFPLTLQPQAVNGLLLPNSFLLDIRLILPSQQSTNISGQFYISQIRDMGNTYSVVIGYNGIQCASCVGISKSLGITESLVDRTYIVNSMVVDSNTLETYPWMKVITGNICAGATGSYNGGSLSFQDGAAPIASPCINFIAGSNYLEAFNVNGQLLTGVVQLKAQKGVVLSTNQGMVIFKLDPAYLQALWSQRLMQILQERQGTPIQTINGIGPDENGNINITGLDCVQINSVSGGVTINNSCAKPCCDSSKNISSVQSALSLVQEQHKVLRDYYNNMANTVNYIQANLSTLMANR